MRSQSFRLSAAVSAGTLAAGAAAWSLSLRAQAAPDRDSKAALTQGFQKGPLEYKAIGPLAFSPSGVLFFADDQAGAVYGVDLQESVAKAKAAPYAKVPDLGAALAGRMGTTPAGIEIKDIAVSPVSRSVYLSVRKTDGTDQNPANPANYALFAVSPEGKVTPVALEGCRWGKVAVSGKPSYSFRNSGTPRVIGDLAYAGGRVFAAALHNEQFASNLVSIPVPFRADGVERHATSIYHISHKKQETASPVQTLTAYRDGDKEYLMAAYVCTPVVRFNLDELKPGAVVTGATVAELGSGNRPMAMIAYGKPGEQHLLLNNSSFGILKVDAKIAKETAVNEQAKADRGGGGKTPFAGIEPVAALKDAKAYVAPDAGTLLVVKPTADGGMALEPMPAP